MRENNFHIPYDPELEGLEGTTESNVGTRV